MVTEVVIALSALGAALLVGGWLRRRTRLIVADRPDTGRREQFTAEDLNVSLGERATLVQFSSAFCQPCRATRRVLGEVAEMVDGVKYVEIDAESRLDLVRRIGILRTPTVLVLDPAGAIVRRASGQPRKVDVIAALSAVVH